MPSEAAKPLTPLGGATCEPITQPPARWFRLYDGRTLGWGGPTWQGRWTYGEAVFAAAPVNGWDLGEPLGDDGKKLEGGWVSWHKRPFSPPSDRTPTPVQLELLEQLPAQEGWVTALDGNKQRTAYSLDLAGWVYWAGPKGWATLHLTEAGEKARERGKAARRRKLDRWKQFGRPPGS